MNYDHHDPTTSQAPKFVAGDKIRHKTNPGWTAEVLCAVTTRHGYSPAQDANGEGTFVHPSYWELVPDEVTVTVTLTRQQAEARKSRSPSDDYRNASRALDKACREALA